jgi:peptide/nickel transport system permease protein
MPEQPRSPIPIPLEESVETGIAPHGATGLEPVPGVAQAIAVEATPVHHGKRKIGIGAWISIVWLAAITGSAILAPVLPIAPVNARYPEIVRKGPGTAGHILGGDSIGHDLFSRLIWGARNSLTVGVCAVGIGFLIGGMLGLLAGYHRGRFETVVVAILDILLSFPALVLALSLSIFLRGRVILGVQMTGLMTVILALGITAIPAIARIARASTLTWSQREFVLAARAQGAKNRRIIFREVLPNVVPAMLSFAFLAVAIVIVAEAALSIIGAGIGPDKATWGNIINDGRGDLTTGEAPHIVFCASAVIFLTVMSLNYIGDTIRQRFDVRESAI